MTGSELLRLDASIQDLERSLKAEIAELLALVLPFINSQCLKACWVASTSMVCWKAKWPGGPGSVSSPFITGWVVP